MRRSCTKHSEMIETAESDVQIILSIKEGRDFEEVLHPTFLIGTLNGYSLDTDKVDSCPNPQYEIDLVWETNKTILRRLRSGQVPLKLECFAFKENGDKEKLGYVLLNIRSAQVMCQQKNPNVKASWHKLLGLRSDLKMHKPELLLALSIEDKKSSSSNPSIKVESSVIDNSDINVQNDEIVPYLYSNEQLIQLGPPNACYEYFLLSITITSVENLHLLLPEHLSKDSFVHFLYRVLENDIKLELIETESGKFGSLYEKVTIKMRSSLNMLKYYLQSKPHMLIFLKHENNIIAESSVNLQSLVLADNLIEPLKCNNTSASTVYKHCFLTKRDSVEKSSESQCEKCYLDLEFKLLYIGNKVDTVYNPDTISFNNQIVYHNQENKNNTNQRCPGVEFSKTSSGNIEKFNSNDNFDDGIRAAECNNVNKHTGCQCLNCHMDKVTHSCTCDAMPCNCINKHYNTKSTGSYHCYCLHILIMAVTLVSAKFSKRQIDFRVHHPKAEITSTVHLTMPVSMGETVKLHESGCQFHFISTPDEIKQLLDSFPPKISMHDTNENAEPLSSLVLNLKSLFDKPEYQQTVLLYDTDQNKICEMDIMLKLEDRGLHFILKKESSRKNLGPPILDDSLAYKIVDELETWKERQKEMFKSELKKKEERHLNMLSEEWRKQKETLESKLACSVEQCKILAANLNSATEDLKTRRLKSLENETRLIKANEELHWRYEIKVQELKDSLHAVQADLTAKVAKLEEQKAALEAQLKVLLCENENMKLSINKQMDELQMYQKGSLTRDQTTSLLQEVKLLEEKLENAQRGKLFFKEQWAKTVREIHKMKVDYQQAMQVQIKNSKEELKNVELAEILSIDKKALNNDQILLNELQKEVNTIKPRQHSDSTEISNHVCTPNDNIERIYCNSNKPLLHKSEEYERLQALREERDSLLKTGSYTPDDVVIRKLNSEIGALLVSK